MKLYHTPTSPFVRKVMVAAHELALIDRIETIFLRPSPLKADPELARTNPLSKIPALVLDDGTVLYDSSVICEALEEMASGRRIIPEKGPERWRALRVQSLCDGILEAAIQVFYEGQHRPKEMRWEPWCAGQSEKARLGLDALEADVASFGAAADIGQITAGSMLGWLVFRGVLGDVLAERPKLSRWYETFSSRPSMQATAPHA